MYLPLLFFMGPWSNSLLNPAGYEKGAQIDHRFRGQRLRGQKVKMVIFRCFHGCFRVFCPILGL